ncbi:MAG TPA: dienelactone hydrolase family protein [Nannocystaceae bacterium]|nr:dienelactone hydrolase family protein [Nannocystaceae bacterium]
MQRSILALVLVLGCRPASPGPAPAATPPPTPAPATDAKRCTLAPGDGEIQLEVGELQRRYLVHVGAQLAAPPAVVFAWHGFGSGPESALRSMAAAQLWGDAIVVAPQGEPRTFEQFGDRSRAGWQVAKGELGDRDLAFFDAILAELDARGCVDRKRVYSTGFSNGGFFTNVLACHRGAVLAAAAPAGGGGPFERCSTDAQVPVLVTHGRRDQVVDYAMATDSFARWVAHNGCSPDARAPADGCAEATGCPKSAPVRMCSLDIGHEWPEGQAERTRDFLRAFTRP